MSTDQPVAVVIEDEADTRDLIVAVLQRSGFRVVEASNGRDGIAAVHEHEPAITTVDVSMPGMDGHATVRRLREFSSTYLIMLSGHSDEIDVVEGLDAGADDYIIKPFRPRELRARIGSGLRKNREAAAPAPVYVGSEPERTFEPEPAPEPAVRTAPVAATFQRTYVTEQPSSGRAVARAQRRPAPAATAAARPTLGHTPAPAREPAATAVLEREEAPTAVLEREEAPAAHGAPGLLHHRGVELDLEAREVHLEGLAVELTRTEFDLLATMLASGRRVRTKADLVLTLRGETFVTNYLVTEADKRAISVHMANLRRKLDEDASQPRWIETVRGVGYRLTAAH